VWIQNQKKITETERIETMATDENGLGHLFISGVSDTSASLTLRQAIGTLNVLSTTGDQGKDTMGIDAVNATSTKWVDGNVKTSQCNSATNSNMSDATEVQDDTQVEVTAGFNDPGTIPWRTAGWRGGSKDAASAKVASRVGVSQTDCLSLECENSYVRPAGNRKW